MEPYVEDVLDTFLQAITTRKVKNLPQYMKSLLWTSFATYKLNTISGINLNQIAHLANATGKITEDQWKETHQLLEKIWDFCAYEL